jgi:hypothetical protein
MTRVIACIQLMVFLLALSVPRVMHGGTNSIQQTVHRSSRKSYLKHQKKVAKKMRKSQKKAQNRLKSRHQIAQR